jgi:hypothetical protein
MTLTDAIAKMVRDAETRGGERCVVLEDDGEYYSIPTAYLNDASYEGSRNVVTQIQEGSDLFGSDWTFDEDEIEREAQWAVDTYESEWMR